jgi:hypothetical protein
MEDLKNIVETINNSDNWLDCLSECEKLCDIAGLSEKWQKADSESFEIVLKEASNLLNIDIGL